MDETSTSLARLAILHVDESNGSDEGDGSIRNPLKSTLAAYTLNLDAQVLTRKAEENEYKEISASGSKKTKKLAEVRVNKAKKQQEELRIQQEAQQRKLDEAKAIEIHQDKSLPLARKIKIRDSIASRGQRIKIFGWLHSLRSQKGLIFIDLRDGTGYIQCVLSGQLAQTYDALTLTLETTIAVYGVVAALPEGKSAFDNHELTADFFEVIGKAPGGEDAFLNIVAEDSKKLDYLLDQRHLVLRRETEASLFKVRAAVLKAFRQSYDELGLLEVTPPCMVQTQVEGGGTLFEFNYYGKSAYLTQSSQLYLETCLPSLGDVFCVQESFRAEKSMTRRHLSEYTHVEAEIGFVVFEDLLVHIEEVICRTITTVLSDPYAGPMIAKLNPSFVPPTRPFMRLEYKDAITYLNEHHILKEDGSEHEFGDDIAEAAERAMTDQIGLPIFLTRFPVEIKSFYMKKCEDDRRVTESVDVLMPGVGEITGGSMRIDEYEELLEGYAREGIDPKPYYWYTDQRKYGTCSHGGYGLGLERFLAWLCDRFTVRDLSLYPRFTERCRP